MAAQKAVLLVFLFPFASSLVFGSYVMASVLEQPERNLNMWPFEKLGLIGEKKKEHSSLEILGLSETYTVEEPVNVEVKVKDKQFDCGDLYITVYNTESDPKEVVFQSGYLDQCFVGKKKSLPVDDEFSEKIDKPGSYQIKAEMNDKSYKESIKTIETFKITS